MIKKLFKKIGTLSQLGERQDCIQMILRNATIVKFKMKKNFFFVFVLSFIFYKNSFSDDLFKLTIPNENYRSENQKINEIKNFKNSGLTEKEWRIKKCYRNVVFNIFWNSNLCPNDPHMCHHSYTVEELHMYKKYWNYLLQISELCADGYVVNKSDKEYFKKSTQGEVNRFIEYVKKGRKKKIDYNNPSLNKSVNEINKQKVKTKKRVAQTGAHGAIQARKEEESGNAKKLNAVPVEPVVVQDIENSKKTKKNEPQVNKKELEILKKQVKELKKTEKKKQKEIENLKKSESKKRKELEDARKAEKKRLKELESARKADEKRLKELESARKADEKRQKELKNISTKVETKDIELEKTRKADEEKRRQLELAKKQLNYVKKELESIKTEEVDNLKKELDEMTRGDDTECVGEVEFQMECVEKNAQGKRYYFELKKIGNFICSKLKITENNYSYNSYRKVYGKVLESDTKKGRFIVSEYGSTGENKEKMIYDFNQKQKFMDIDDPFSFERCK